MGCELKRKCENENKSDVVDFYSGKSVLVTGGTGFLGKVLIEKLLYSCKNIDKVYVIVREKKGVLAMDRISQIIISPVFKRIKDEMPENLNKIIPLLGDVCKSNLGLTHADLKRVEEEVSVVFHVAAAIGFTESLKDSLTINVIGTENTVNLCHHLKKIQAFVHVSTAYCNTDRYRLEETVYPTPHTLEYALKMSEKYSDNEEIIKLLIGKRPNTYTYSKTFAEEIVASKCNVIPAAIIRPSIVTASVQEPCPGWIDNWNGPTGILTGFTMGVTRVIVGKGKNLTDLIPVDIVTNLTIVAATRCERSDKVKVYNCCSGKSNPITIGETEKYIADISVRNGLNIIPFPFVLWVTSKILFTLLIYILHIIPAYIMDCWCSLMGEKTRYVRIQQQLRRAAVVLEYFMLNQWDFDDHNVRILLDSLSEYDKETFNFDVKSFTWKTYLSDYILGIQKYLNLKKAPVCNYVTSLRTNDKFHTK